MEEILKEIEELKKRVAALEEQVQVQPIEFNLAINGKEIVTSVDLESLRCLQARSQLCGR